MNTRVFFCGDTHFGHRNILKFEAIQRHFATIEEHDERIIENWNKEVRPKDMVYHLGDVAFGGVKTLEKLSRLNGLKRLVMGNHDRYPTAEYLKYFEKLYGAVTYKGMIMTHVPVHPHQFYRYKGNIHGHLHHNVMPDERYINVSLERWNMAPVSYDFIRTLIDQLPNVG